MLVPSEDSNMESERLANAHRADERLPLADLHKATEVVTLSLLDLLASR